MLFGGGVYGRAGFVDGICTRHGSAVGNFASFTAFSIHLDSDVGGALGVHAFGAADSICQQVGENLGTGSEAWHIAKHSLVAICLSRRP